MKHFTLRAITPNTLCRMSSLYCDGNANEYHITVECTSTSLSFAQQAEEVLQAFKLIMKDIRETDAGNTEEELGAGNALAAKENARKSVSVVFKRYFLSDSANQYKQLQQLINMNEAGSEPCAVSFVQQPPLGGGKVALWAYCISGMECKQLTDGMIAASHGGYQHLWTGFRHVTEGSSAAQTACLFNDYNSKLEERGCTLADNCVRTWLFVNDIDNNYAGMVQARNDIFTQKGLTADTHFIASTGISGRNHNAHSLIQLDAYAVQGISKEQMHWLYASDKMNRTSDYGVRFERGTYIDYADRRQVFISGTASIGSSGEVLHVGDVANQTRRMLDNVETLLDEAQCGFEDIGQMLVYLRDIADRYTVANIIAGRFPNMPCLFLHAPVCRPEWLVEMECMGVKRMAFSHFSSF